MSERHRENRPFQPEPARLVYVRCRLYSAFAWAAVGSVVHVAMYMRSAPITARRATIVTAEIDTCLTTHGHNERHVRSVSMESPDD